MDGEVTREPVPVNVDDIFSVLSMSDDPPPAEEPPAPAAPAAEPTPAAPAQPQEPAAAPSQPQGNAPAAAPAADPAPPAPAAAPPAPVVPLPGLDGGAQPPAAATPPAPSADPRDLALANMQAQIEALQAQLLAQPAGATPAPAETPQQELARLVKPEEYAYSLGIPQEVLGAIFNEDANVAAQGMHHLINNLAGIIHRNVLGAARKDLEAYRTEVQSHSQTSDFEKQKQAAQDDYYKTFPAHNDPVIKLVVAQEAQKLGQEYPNLPWGDQFRNALGARVEQAVATLRGGQQPPAQDPTAQAAPGITPNRAPVQPPNAPASFLPVNPSGGIPHFENDREVIASTFSFG